MKIWKLLVGRRWMTEPATSNDVGRKRRTWLAIGLVALLGLGLLGRSLVSDGVANSFVADLLPWLGGTDVTVYFGDETGNYLVPVSRTLTGDDDSIDALAAALLDGPEAGTGLVAVMPAGTTVQSLSVDGDRVDVDLAGFSLDVASRLAGDALVQSLASWPGVEQVRVTVGGSEVGIPTSGRLLFFYEPERDRLVARPTTASDARQTLGEFLAGPGESRLTGLPADVEVLQFESAPGSGLIELNFRYTDSLRAMATDDGEGMRRILEGLIATLTTGAPEVDFVYLDFEGHATLGLGQCANLLRTVQPVPEVLNDERLLDAS